MPRAVPSSGTLASPRAPPSRSAPRCPWRSSPRCQRASPRALAVLGSASGTVSTRAHFSLGECSLDLFCCAYFGVFDVRRRRRWVSIISERRCWIILLFYHLRALAEHPRNSKIYLTFLLGINSSFQSSNTR
ncbi:basic proline-rich protein-like [Iris pallida]|uniref:Basic proline-rich protein-like n=1 Tax=Iris pallida TaxID=29817 RepID=A0AAX6EMP8_IRIPA|nr:basic proline-rich protein-like [Iris pallida]